jgi:hypothetical protein
MYYNDKIKEDEIGGYVTRMGENTKFLCGNMNGRDRFANLGVGRRIILKSNK